ncbi:MAG: VOC family protein [Motilibacteraceae bacterium]
MRLDHVSYAASHDQLLDVVQRIGSSLGAGFSDGGRHPRFGTQNFVLPLAGGTYLEVVAALDHPSAERAPFGRAVRRRADDGGGWLGWVVSVDDIAPVEQRLGRPAADANRHRPDGFDLQWKQIGVNDLIEDPQLPFFIQWLVNADQHPSTGAHDGVGGVRIARLEIAGSPDRVAQWLGEPEDHPLDDVEVDWVDGDEPGLVAVTFATPGGDVRID